MLSNYFLDNYVLVGICCLMIFVLLTGPKQERRKQTGLVGLFAALLLLSVVVSLDAYLTEKPNYIPLRYVLSVIGYLARPFLIAQMAAVIDPGILKKVLFWIPFLVNALFYVSSPFTHVCFWFDSEGDFQEGPMYLMMLTVCIVYLVILIGTILSVFLTRKTSEMLILIFTSAYAVGGALIDMFVMENGAFFMTVFAVSLIIYYLYILVQKTRERELEQLLEIQEKQNELHEKNVELMTSQIQPHFLYNTLASVQYLIRTNPELAESGLQHFTKYLRGNMNAMGETLPVPFERELEHVKNYVFIEQMRFPNITVEYDIRDEIFDVPSLTLQPLVENAIKHGICGIPDGTVSISAYYENENHVIMVKDNGAGFHYTESGEHVGLKNVRTRLRYMVNGSLTVESEPGKGTTVMITVPEKEEPDENLFD